jgi:TonB family protein
MRRFFSFCALTVTLALLAAFPAYGRPSEVEQHLRDEYLGKTFVLRGFYPGDRLQYDSEGALRGDANAGDWTSDGFVQVKEVHVSRGHLTIEAERLLVVHFEAREFQFDAEEKLDKRKLKIDADLGSAGDSPETADALMSKIFVTAHEELADMVPDYWKPCVRMAGSGGDNKCRFSSELMAIPGTTASAKEDAGGCKIRPAAGECSAGHPGRSREAHPTATYSPGCEFTDRARKAKFQGTVNLALVVDEQGLPRDIHITRPVGMGLDEQALKCVSQWRFKPAEQDGQPFAAEIAVRVDFHLY